MLVLIAVMCACLSGGTPQSKQVQSRTSSVSIITNVTDIYNIFEIVENSLESVKYYSKTVEDEEDKQDIQVEIDRCYKELEWLREGLKNLGFEKVKRRKRSATV